MSSSDDDAVASIQSLRTTGCCVWLTGLSGSGKSTTALGLSHSLSLEGHTAIVLDGDALRSRVSAGLGFSRSDRHTNVLRAARIARDIVSDGGIAICSLISPYRDARDDARNLIGPNRFVEVFVDTPLAVCQIRDPKGLYARSRRGEVRGVSGIDDPYESPLMPDLVLCTERDSVRDNVDRVMSLLRNRNVISG